MSASAHRYTCDQLGACQSRPTPCTSCTPDPYLLNTARLHRVDASQLPQGTGVSLGHCRTDLPAQRTGGCTQDCAQGKRCTCAPATTATPHTEPAVPEAERDAVFRARVWLSYIAGLLAVCWGVWQWLSR